MHRQPSLTATLTLLLTVTTLTACAHRSATDGSATTDEGVVAASSVEVTLDDQKKVVLTGGADKATAEIIDTHANYDSSDLDCAGAKCRPKDAAHLKHSPICFRGPARGVCTILGAAFARSMAAYTDGIHSAARMTGCSVSGAGIALSYDLIDDFAPVAKDIEVATVVAACGAGPDSPGGDDDGLGWIADPALREKVREYAKVGQPEIRVAAAECADEPGEDLVTSDFGRMCMDRVALPADIQRDVAAMARQRFDNDSDYDNRVTVLEVFRHRAVLAGELTEADVRRVAAAFGVPKAMTEGMRINEHTGDFGMLRGLTIDGKFHADPAMRAHVRSLIGNETARMHSFGPEEIGLYPGGGFNARFYVITTSDLLIYIKLEYWNS